MFYTNPCRLLVAFMRTNLFARVITLSFVLLCVVACNLIDRLKTSNVNSGNGSTPNANSTANQPGHVFTSEEGRFTVTLPPGYPRPERRGEFYQSLVPDRGMCLLIYRDLPPREVRGSSAREILNRRREQIPQRLIGDLETTEDITVQGYPGIRFLASRGATGGRFDLILVGTRLYEVAFAAPRKEERDAPEVRAYFDSFRITGDAPVAPSPSRGRRR